MKKIVSILLILAMLFSLAACAAQKPAKQQDGQVQSVTEDENNKWPSGKDSGGEADTDASQTAKVAFAADYGEVYNVLMKLREVPAESGTARDSGTVTMEETKAEAEAPAEDNAAGKEAGGGDYSGTNVQVEGVDEGDIVKTDGKFIYVIHGENLNIYSADNGKVKLVSDISVAYYKSEDGDNYSSSESKSPMQMFVNGDRLALISNCWSWWDGKDEASGEWKYRDNSSLTVDFYDITDRSNPKLITNAAQDGYMTDVRMVDGTVYAVSGYYVYNPVEGDVSTYIPRLYKNGVAETMKADCICIPFNPSEAYTVAAMYDMTTGEMTGSKAVMANSNTVFMDAERLIVAGSKYYDNASAPRTESVYEVIDHYCGTKTELTCFDISDGKLDYLATTLVDGYLDSQFSMDRYNGCLRLVTTENTYSYTTYEDKKMGFYNSKWADDGKTVNALYVLDADMSVVGTIGDLAEGERVYSARFDGDIGYFCTFKEVDPLFAVDLSDPTAPKILSALKIPGFSEYLHVWEKGSLLFGLGYDTVEDSYRGNTFTRTDKLKLSMFDVSDPANVTEKWKLSTDYEGSAAIYNHKAILINANKNIIAFPADDGYVVYGFSTDDGFFQKGVMGGIETWNARGLYIDGYFYVVGQNRILAVSMEDFTIAGNTAM